MPEPGGAARRESNKRRSGLGWLLAGVVLGVLGTIFLPDLAAPWLPDTLREDERVAGVVEAKSTGGDRLLLTVGSDAGATLVTFRDDIDEIDLLVSIGDSVVLAVDDYEPFIDDARITRVLKPADWRPAAADPVGDTGSEAAADTAGDAAGQPETVDDTIPAPEDAADDTLPAPQDAADDTLPAPQDAADDTGSGASGP